ncbi:hypothetical protein [Streptomyces lushanensis]|uniref:hypothetical protein n=1 Tax=Streptomyces lushanensis TaxID=1434255 RepID=UPI001FE14E15|nr:hypothetical protein [Streptomyces lushanensis]
MAQRIDDASDPAQRHAVHAGAAGGSARLTGLLVAAALAVVNWLLAHWWVLAVVGALAVLAGGGRLHQKRQSARWEAVRAQGLRYGLSQLDALHHSRFEDAVRELMNRDGCFPGGACSPCPRGMVPSALVPQCGSVLPRACWDGPSGCRVYP